MQEMRERLKKGLTRIFLRDKPGKRLPCLYEQAFAGQRTANGFAVRCLRYRVDRIGGKGLSLSDCTYESNGAEQNNTRIVRNSTSLFEREQNSTKC